MARFLILIVEDDPLLALDLESVVAGAVDTEFILARSVAAGKKLISAALDLALLDVDVTNGKTYGLARLLQAQKVPTLFTSSTKPTEVPDELREIPFMRKPFDERKLVRWVQETLLGEPI